MFLVNCKQEKTAAPSASEIIDRSIEVSGGTIVQASTIDFKFRNRHYKAIRDGGDFQLIRYFKDSIYDIRDVVNNQGFTRFKNGKEVEVVDSMATSYAASVNSVHYFSVLPYSLDGKAVNSAYLEKTHIKDRPYHKIKVTFDEHGGGEDFEDVFVYWVNAETYKVDYLAYSYNEADGLGFRFREAYYERYIEGIRFVDYRNYKPKTLDLTVANLDDLFEKNQLELLSKIELENINVSAN